MIARHLRELASEGPSVARVLLGASVLSCAIAGCSSESRAPVVPVPTLASTPAAQAAYRKIEGRWTDLPPERKKELLPELRDFLTRYPVDDRARMVRLYFALLSLDEGRFGTAHSLARQVQAGPPGAAKDFADVVEAATLRREGKLTDALALLEPLRGKIADPEQLGIYSEQFVRALVSAHAFEHAISAMVDWAEQTPQVEREQVVTSIDGLIKEMPTAAIEGGLATLADEDRQDAAGPRSTRSEARRWLITTARARLVRMALTNRDPELARRLLDSASVRIGGDESREALVALAATGLGSAKVAGRSVGIVLDVADDTSRRRSSEVVEGMSRALGLPASASDKRAVQLLTRDATDPADVDRALRGLAGDGASILVAGVTHDAAAAASSFAERSQVPVIVVSAPPSLGALRFTFVLGGARDDVSQAIDARLAAVHVHSVAAVGVGGAPCESTASAGQTRFPVQDWKHDGIDALVLRGDAECTRDAVMEVNQLGLSPLLVLGLESAEAEDSVPGRKLLVTAGRFPFGAAPMNDEERAYVDRWGSAPSWFEALGHDAAVLAAAVLADFPLDRVDDKGAVVGLHWRAQGRLLHAEVPLWTSASRGFAGASVLSRRFDVVAPGGAASGLAP
ncbi:MAG TPA: hypothetical protein VH062_14715 [Polyangiaceae bacterium]|nr:hypothetical protein [Polyangiaceae bacterium]